MAVKLGIKYPYSKKEPTHWVVRITANSISGTLLGIAAIDSFKEQHPIVVGYLIVSALCLKGISDFLAVRYQRYDQYHGLT